MLEEKQGPSLQDINFSAEAAEEPKQDSNLHIGVTRDKAGNPDYSKAAVWKLSPKEQAAFKKGAERITTEKEEARRKKLEIPPEVLPGTSTMVRYRLRNAKFLKEEKLNGLEGNARQRTQAEMEQYADEEAIVEDLERDELKRKNQENFKKNGVKFSGFNSLKETNEGTTIPAGEMIDMVDQLVEKWEEIARKNPSLGKVSIGVGGVREIDYARFLKEAEDLKLRLAAEDSEARAAKGK